MLKLDGMVNSHHEFGLKAGVGKLVDVVGGWLGPSPIPATQGQADKAVG